MTRRVFPSDGLHIQQICDAIREHGLLPAVLDGDHRVELPVGALRGFSRSRFAASCAALIRSGYPVLIAAKLLKAPNDAGHAVTAVGFRPGPSPLAASGSAVEEDGGIVHLYIHDDNLGPSVRFGIQESGPDGVAVLRADPLPPLSRTSGMPNPTQNYYELVPTSIVGAVPDEIRVSADYLNRRALRLAGARCSSARLKASGDEYVRLVTRRALRTVPALPRPGIPNEPVADGVPLAPIPAKSHHSDAARADRSRCMLNFRSATHGTP